MRSLSLTLITSSVAAVLVCGCSPESAPPRVDASHSRGGNPPFHQTSTGRRPGRPPRPAAQVRLAIGSRLGGPPVSLLQLVAKGDTIIVGSVESIVRVAHSPPNSAEGMPHTVFSVAVERYLRADGAPARPRQLRVHLLGGVLDGVADFFEGFPTLTIGERYLLFLRANPERDQWAMVAGTWGKSWLRGEYASADPLLGIIRLVAGRTDVPQDGYQQIAPWRFRRGGDTLLGLTEEEACNQVRFTVSRMPVLTGDQLWSDLP